MSDKKVKGLDSVTSNSASGINPENVRLVLACVLAPPNIALAYFVSKNFGYLEFVTVGASRDLQRLYRQAGLFSCLLKFDLQAACSIVILALKDGTKVSLLETVSLAIGIPYSLFWCLLGWVSLKRELKTGAVVFAILGLIKPCYYLFKIICEYIELNDEKVPTKDSIVYSLIAAVSLGLLVWFMLMIELMFVYKNFNQGLQEKTRLNASETSRLLGDRQWSARGGNSNL